MRRAICQVSGSEISQNMCISLHYKCLQYKYTIMCWYEIFTTRFHYEILDNLVEILYNHYIQSTILYQTYGRLRLGLRDFDARSRRELHIQCKTHGISTRNTHEIHMITQSLHTYTMHNTLRDMCTFMYIMIHTYQIHTSLHYSTWDVVRCMVCAGL